LRDSFGIVVTRLAPLLLLLLAACASDARVEGSLQEERSGVIAVRWGPAGSGLVHGQGQALGARYFIDVEGAPPPAAFHQGVAVGEIVLTGPNTSVRLGAPLDDVHGVAGGFALVQREEEVGADASWAEDFPVGLSCAVESSDGWTPVSCASLEPLRFE
jgi:hypothetical protein